MSCFIAGCASKRKRHPNKKEPNIAFFKATPVLNTLKFCITIRVPVFNDSFFYLKYILQYYYDVKQNSFNNILKIMTDEFKTVPYSVLIYFNVKLLFVNVRLE